MENIKRLFLFLAILILPIGAYAQPEGGSPGTKIQSQSNDLGRVRTMNFSGAGVTTTISNGIAQVNIASSGSSVSDIAYGASWNGVTTIAPSKNSVYAKIETLGTPNHSHSQYVPYAGAVSTVKIGSQHFAANSGEFNSLIINNTPTASNNAATKGYVDNTFAGLSPKSACKVATTANLSASYLNGVLTNTGALVALSIDGVNLATSDRVLVKNQTSSLQNGIYSVTTVGSGVLAWVLTRSTDYDESAEITEGSYTDISEGTANADTLWVQSTSGTITIGVSPITFKELLIAPQAHAHSNYVPYTGATQKVNLGNQHLTTTGSIEATRLVTYGSPGVLNANNVNGTTYYLVNGDNDTTTGLYFFPSASDVNNDQLGFKFGGVSQLTVTRTGVVTGPLSLQVGSSGINTSGQITSTLAKGTAPFVITSQTLIPNLYVAHAQSADRVSINQHDTAYPSASQFQSLSSLATTNSHAKYYANKSHQHSAYSTGTSSTARTVNFEYLASPQALQGIEQLRHVLSAYQNYGEITVNGLIDQTGETNTHQLTYTGSSSYQYAIASSASGTLLSHFDGLDAATSYTAETGQVFTFVGTAQLDTAQTKFGLSSLLLDGNSYVTLPDNDTWSYGTGDFTIDMWIRFASTTGEQGIYVQSVDGGNFFKWRKDANNKVSMLIYSGSVAKYDAATTSALTINNNQWYHFEFSRVGTSGYLFQDGVSQALTVGTDFGVGDLGNLAAVLVIGADTGNVAYINGWIDEVHIIKGTGNSVNFTPPAVPYGSSQSNGFLHSIVFPIPNVPTHMGVTVKLDSDFTSDQHTYLKLDVSRNGGTTFTDCHPITKVGNTNSGYYRGAMTSVASQSSGKNVVTKISLAGSTTKVLKGYGVYAE